MRIVVAATHRRKVGGVESYLDSLLPALAGQGHEVAFLHENDGPPDRGLISLPPRAPSWSIDSLGTGEAIDRVRAWGPDVVFCQGLSSPGIEAELLTIAPAVLFAHAYHGTCIAGSKSRLSPHRMPCGRTLAWPCLVHYFPRRCGGLSPVTMVRQYNLQRTRRDMLGAYSAVVTASTHMRNEYLRHGVAPSRVHSIDLPIAEVGAEALRSEPGANDADARDEVRLLFLGRLYRTKGAHLLLEALRLVRVGLGRRIRVTLGGDGPERERLGVQAGRIERRDSDCRIDFAGWLSAVDRNLRVREADLLVVPSIWPEPFGLVGPEAGALGLPAAAFAVGGIPDWLHDGVNGHLASGHPPSAPGLAAAIVASLHDPVHHASLRRGAVDVARRFTLSHHVGQLMPILEGATGAAQPVAPGR